MSQGFAREARIGVDLHVGETLYYTANDTFAKADYPGLYGVKVIVVGAGGGGGGALGGSDQGESGAGGGGGTSIKIIETADLGTSETITIGSGGSGGTGSGSGSAGTSSSFGSHCSATAGGGGTGSGNSSGNLSRAGGDGGSGSGGDLNIFGRVGGRGRVINGVYVGTSVGGSSYFGGGGAPTGSADPGVDGENPGVGGSGAVTTTTNRAGGDGADGIIIVEVLYERKIAVDEDIHTQYLNDTRHNAAHGAIRAGLSADQTISSSASSSTVVFDTIIDEDDPDGDLTLDTGTGLITCNNAGWYQVTGGILWASNSTSRRATFIFQNSNPVANNQVPGSAFSPQTIATLIKCSAADTIKINVAQETGSNLDVLSNDRTFLAVVKVREA